MDTINGLKEYITRPEYRNALGLPKKVTETYRLLAQGEYNRNYEFTHPVTKKKLLLRVNLGSQMHLPNQIRYEYDALKLLKPSGRTPDAYYVDESLSHLDYGVMVMEFLPGHALDYRTELYDASEILADIHSVPVGENHGLIKPEDPLKAILLECEEMVKTYMDSSLGQDVTKKKLRAMLDRGWKKWEETSSFKGYCCCINTELNSTNFLMNKGEEKNYLIDWEKPLYGEPAQDLGHFLAPTTTFWKTDVILGTEETERFLDRYFLAAGSRFDTRGIRERAHVFIPITCLRGVAWCAMAWVEYQEPGRILVNASTAGKLAAYLEHAFLDRLPI